VGIDLDLISSDQCLLVVDDDVALLTQPDAEMVAFETDQVLTRLELLFHGDPLALNIIDFTEGRPLESLLPSPLVEQSQRLPAPARSLLQYLHQQPKTKRLNFRQAQFAQASQGASGNAWLWQLGKVALFVAVLQLLFTGAQGLYLFDQASSMAAEAKTLYQGLYPNDQNPRDLGRRWRSRLNAGGQQDQVGLTAVLDTVSPALVAARLQLDNLNFNAGRGDLMLQLSGDRSEQIMGLAEVLNAAGFQSEIGTISQEKSSVRGSLRVRMGGRP
jgi:general secretion pathway protein L